MYTVQPIKIGLRMIQSGSAHVLQTHLSGSLDISYSNQSLSWVLSSCERMSLQQLWLLLPCKSLHWIVSRLEYQHQLLFVPTSKGTQIARQDCRWQTALQLHYIAPRGPRMWWQWYRLGPQLGARGSTMVGTQVMHSLFSFVACLVCTELFVQYTCKYCMLGARVS